MSPMYPRYQAAYDGGPRASGDEPPAINFNNFKSLWSPRERG